MTIIFAKVGLKTAMTERPPPEDSLEEGRKIKKQKNNENKQTLRAEIVLKPIVRKVRQVLT